MSDKKELLLIIAAGKGTRMGDQTIPKALRTICGETNIERTIANASNVYDNIFVVVSDTQTHHFMEYDFINTISISSGLGDGDAILKAMTSLEENGLIFDDYNTTILWGDTYIENSNIFEEITEREDFFSIPVKLEKDPYVSFAINDDNEVMYTLFSKYGEKQSYGLHDQSIFRTTDTEQFYIDLLQYRNYNWKGSRYATENGEMNMLNLMHYFYNSGNPAKVYITDYRTFSYNTEEELQEISNKLFTNT